MRNHACDAILPLVQKPARYTGGELNAVRTKSGPVSLSFALAFPDVYEVGMSHQGLQILYGILNSRSDWLAERVYAPWPDMTRLMTDRGLALYSLETGTPLHRFDIVGFSLQYELCGTNVLSMLELGRIPLRSSERRDEHPLVIAGGPCAFNPEPFAPFFDAFALGEAEELVVEIAHAVAQGKKTGRSRRFILQDLAELDGVYVPDFYKPGRSIRKRVVADLDEAFVPEKPVVPVIQTIHDRITLEIARGCTRGCRFCQAGMVWRPLRERSPSVIADWADRAISATGYDELSLLSLSSGDYSCIGPLVLELMNRYASRRVALALPSLRPETLTGSLIEQIKRVRKTSFTLAPEAGTERLRRVINKGNSEQDLLETAHRVFEAGWKSIKLYFMTGLPTERTEDLEGIVNTAYQVLKAGGNRRQVTVGLSTFVPKPHTPFQWERQIGMEETEERQRFLRKNLRHGNLKLKWHDHRMSLLEGLVSRGDRGTADLIERAFRLGARFDGWSDQIQFACWEQAFRDVGVNPASIGDSRSTASPLPWDHIDCGLTRDFLLREHDRSRREESTADCRYGGCYGCGACGTTINIRLAAGDHSAAMTDSSDPAESSPDPRPTTRIRLHYRKAGPARFLSHLDTAAALIRAVSRSGLSFEYSRGYHPSPRISFPSATPVGVESESEYADIRVYSPREFRPGHLVNAMNASLPEGLLLHSMEEITGPDSASSSRAVGFLYEMHLDRTDVAVAKSPLEQAVATFLNADRFIIHRTKSGETIERDIRPCVESLVYDDDRRILRGLFRITAHGGVKPQEILTHVLGMDEDAAKQVRAVKRQTLLMDG